MAYSVRRALGTSEIGKHPKPDHETATGFFAELCLKHLHPAEVRPVVKWFDAVKPEHQRMFTTDAVLALGVAFAVAEGLRKPGTVLERPPTLGDYVCAFFEGRLLHQELSSRETIVSVLYKPPPKAAKGTAKGKVDSPPLDSTLKTQYGTTLERTVSRLSSGGAVSEGGEPRDRTATPREVVLGEDERRPILLEAQHYLPCRRHTHPLHAAARGSGRCAPCREGSAHCTGADPDHVPLGDTPLGVNTGDAASTLMFRHHV